MFGRKCSLCGGKLDSNNVCKECGLDNTKSDKYYQINQSRCDNKPLTHVHEDDWKEKAEKIKKRVSKPEYTYQTQKTAGRKKEKSGKNSLASIIVSCLSLLFIIVPAVLGIVDDIMEPSYSTEEVYYDPYEYVEVEHPEDGEYLSYTLKTGQYIVGVHIAEGNYYSKVVDNYDTVQVEDDENGIYLYEYLARDEENYLDDLRLFNGAIVTITSKEGILLKTDNGQIQTMNEVIENPVKESYNLEMNCEAEAGVDFEPGVYDLYTDADYAYINLTIVDETGEEWDYYGNWEIGKETNHGECFQNMVLPEGVKISSMEGNVELVPSIEIADMDYSDYYY